MPMTMSVVNCFVQGSGSLPDEPLHVKEALSRLVVEITKREWPQKWGSLLPDLNSICALGVSQVLFTCLIFLLQTQAGFSLRIEVHVAGGYCKITGESGHSERES